ncbi:DHA2 family efflux MFS transporter permease subunit [Sphingomonas bacterium]|uniref:DHA2 family efflux MFS transporter permease subunit n=1 Tax=Sphingomonas bacterium TaxID=1895847 RepID=UPI001577576B|nr:DHA2 family efflux MFS transporter permease subunit [Sphingomonas bacterium]
MASAAATGGGWNKSRSVAGRYSPWLIVAIISIPTFMEVLDTSIANVALQYIAGGLSISSDEATWTLTSYLVANAIVIPISGWLSDTIGRKRYFIISIILFTSASFVCGIAPNLQVLVLARIAQGIGGGGLAPVEQSMLADTFPPSQRAMAFAAFAIVVVVGPVLGPTLGGFITEHSSWHWVFLINVPVGIAAVFLVELFVDEPEQVKKDRDAKTKRGVRIDWVGILLIAGGLGCLEITADRGERAEWFASPLIVTTTIVAVLSLIALVVWELGQRDPVVDVRLFKNRNFSMTLIVMMMTGLVLFGTTQLIPQMLQQVLGYSALDAGLAMTVGGIATLVAVPIAGVLSSRMDVRILLVSAFCMQVAALWYLAHLNANITFWQASTARLISAAGLPFLFVPINAVAYEGLKQTDTAQASSLLNVFRNLGGTLGISTAQTLLAHQQQIHQSRLVESAQPLNPAYNDYLGSAGQALGGQGGGMGGDGSSPALGALYGTVTQQASMEAFISVFWVLMWLVIVVTPLVFLMRKSSSGGGPGGAH